MNFKSLILGSAAALVAAGGAQAADLPVAEPVDYVRVCDAYGAGYYFIPGTDTCLRIFGSVTFGITSHGFNDKARTDDLTEFYTETTIRFQAMEETEFGTLQARVELDDASTDNSTGGVTGAGVAVDKMWLSLGGFYAGLTDSLLDYNAGIYYDDFGIGQGDVNVIGYNAALGNGVTASIALEEYDANEAGTNTVTLSNVTVNGAAGNTISYNETGARMGTSMPSIAASLAVEQGWGSIEIGASVFQHRFANPAVDTKLGYFFGGEASFNITEALSLGVAGGYRHGGTATGTSLDDEYAVSAGLGYDITDQFTVGADVGYTENSDTNRSVWGTSTGFEYSPVKNLTVAGRVGYQEFNAPGSANDWDDYRGRITIERSF